MIDSCLYRALRLKLAGGSQLDQLSHLALCAGFDAVRRPNDEYIEVAVKHQEGLERFISLIAVIFESSRTAFASGFFTVFSSMSSTQLLRVSVPMFYDDEYAYPQQFHHEFRKANLFDASGLQGETWVSRDFQLKEFAAPMRRCGLHVHFTCTSTRTCTILFYTI